MNDAASRIVSSVANQPLLLMKMRILSLGKNYDIMDRDQRVLYHIGLDSQQNVSGAVFGAAVSSLAGDYLGRYAQRSLSYTYDVTDTSGTLAMQIRKSGGGNSSRFDVVDAQTGGSFGYIEMKRSLIGGLKAAWKTGDGQTIMSSKGNIIRRKYVIVGGNGAEMAKVRHKILAIRDVWQLELQPQVNHLYASIFSIVLDFEKTM